ncbi:MAG: hypothetical protein EBS55_11000, partial [Flavobacteriaceae bacterium]|nr:hypothetical protein [Flavobacteriaceae bacterium]
LNTDGTIDESLDTKNGLDNVVRSLTIKNDQSLIIGGQFSSYNSRQIRNFIRLNTNGLYDGSLNYINGFSKTVRTISIQSDEKIIVTGEFGTYNFDNFGAILRLHSDGSIDNTFVTGLGFDGTVLTTAIQTDGKILVGGLFTTYSGTSANRIIRLNPDGSIDGSFVYGSGFNGDVIKITIHPNGKILVGGSFDVYQSTMSKSIISLNSDGSIDGSFNIGGGFNDVVTTIDVNTNGDIFVGGNFTDYDGTIANRIIGLRPDGGIFVPFNYGLGFNDNVYTISIQSDGKLLIGGEFTEYDGIPSNRIIRLNPDGTIDNTFITGGGFDFTVHDITIQSDGKILVGGNFQFYDVDNHYRIIRLNTDGSVDTSFTTGDGFDDTVFTVVVQPDGKILVGGDFSTYPLRSGIFQLSEGNCVFIDNYEIVSRNVPNGFFTFGPFISCSECTTPDDSPGIESIICVSCDDPESVTSTSVPHGIYLNEQGRAIAQINTVGIGGFNGLNN